MSYYSNFTPHVSPQIQLAQSIIEAQQPLGTPINQHFWEWFSGDALDTIWTFNDWSGGTTQAMSDAVDGGLVITSGSSDNSNGGIHFNSINHYSNIASVMKCVWTVATATSVFFNNGLSESSNPVNDYVFVNIDNDTDTSVYLLSAHNTASSKTASSLTVDTNTHHSEIGINSTFLTTHIDGAFEVIKTTNLPTVDLQPDIIVGTRTTATRAYNFRYMECYNT